MPSEQVGWSLRMPGAYGFVVFVGWMWFASRPKISQSNRVALDVSLVVSNDLLLGIMSFPHSRAREKTRRHNGPQWTTIDHNGCRQVLFALAPCAHLGDYTTQRLGKIYDRIYVCEPIRKPGVENKSSQMFPHFGAGKPQSSQTPTKCQVALIRH